MVNTLIMLLRRREGRLDLIPLIDRLGQKGVSKKEISSEKSKN